MGTGRLFPSFYQETITKGRKGQLDSTVKRFLLDHPNGTLDCGYVVLRCVACGELESDLSLDMYIFVVHVRTCSHLPLIISKFAPQYSSIATESML